METNKHRLVYGLGGGLIYSMGGNGAWRTTLPKILKTFSNPVLVSTVDMPFNATRLIYETVGQDRLYLDSGGFTLYKNQLKLAAPEFAKVCERMRNKFLKMLTVAKYAQIFELDNEYFRCDDDLLSPKNYCRQGVIQPLYLKCTKASSIGKICVIAVCMKNFQSGAWLKPNRGISIVRK